jgi:hypothetical protein
MRTPACNKRAFGIKSVLRVAAATDMHRRSCEHYFTVFMYSLNFSVMSIALST